MPGSEGFAAVVNHWQEWHASNWRLIDYGFVDDRGGFLVQKPVLVAGPQPLSDAPTTAVADAPSPAPDLLAPATTGALYDPYQP